MTEQTPDLRAQLLDALDFAYCQGLGYDTPEALLDAYDAACGVPVPPPADQTAPLAEVWVVWREDESPYGYFATEDAAKRATIDCWEEDEPSCPDYSWRRDGPRWELVVGGEHGGVYASRHRVYGAPEPAAVLAVLPEQTDRAALLRAADIAEDVAESLRSRHEFERSTGALDVMTVLRRVAAEEQPAETQEAPPATLHAIPLPGSNGISSCCGRPPCEFVGERVTRNPDEVTCRGPE
ncbi:hypothetical protein AB0J81_09285 [Streptomyces bobili]|uniref:hypothetical protein n=1 Tax=Streptomyces bobili TaxID=67280 RepID=UPI00341D3A2B